MTVAQEKVDAFKRMSAAYDDVVAVFDRHSLGRDEAFSLAAQIVCQLSEDDQERFFEKMEMFFSMERYLRPQSKEIH